MLSDSPSVQEILRDFSLFKGERGHLTLKDNPHFYADLPKLLKAHGDSIKIDPTEDFRHANTFYVLTDKREVQEFVHIMTGNKILHSFGNLWRSENGIILKGSGIFFSSPVSDVLTDICGRLRGESIVKASLRGMYSRFYIKTLPVSTSDSRVFRTQNDRGLQPIITDLYPLSTSWKYFTSSRPMNIPPGFCICVFTEQVGPRRPVRRNIITFNCIY